MSNVIRFRGRSRPLPPTTDDLLDELTAVQIELARAQLAQVLSETRQANALWFWYCLKRVVFWGIVLWLLTTFASAAQAQTRQFYNANGSFAGSLIERPNAATRYYDGAGRFSGTSVKRGNQTLYYDQQGRLSGSTINTGPRR